jgi:hypothetical protein
MCALNVRARDRFLKRERVNKDLINGITRGHFSLFKRSRIKLVIIVSYFIIFL